MQRNVFLLLPFVLFVITISGATFLYTLSNDFVITHRIAVFPETYPILSEEQKISNHIDGSLFTSLPHPMFDAFSGIGLSENASGYFISAGL